MKAFRILLAWLLIVATSAPAAVINGQLKSAALENLSSDPSSTFSGRVYYNTTTNGAKIYNGTAWTGMGGAGAGEKNYIVNGSSSATGWTASGAGLSTPATDSTAADLPEVTVGTALKLTGASGSSAYAFYPFTLDPSDYSRKLKVSFAQACGLVGAVSAIANCAASDFKVDVYSCTVAWSGSPATTCSGTATRLALSTDSAAVSALPALTGTYRTTFDTGNATAPYLQLRIGMNATQTHAIALSSVVVGPGVVTQGAAVGQWTAYTPTLSASFGTTSGLVAQYRRVGDSLEGSIWFTSGTLTAAVGSVSIPSGLTINLNNLAYAAAAAGGSGQNVGYFTSDSTTGTIGNMGSILVSSTSTSNVYIGGGGTSTGASSTTARYVNMNGYTNTASFGIRFTVPINEWAGSGTVNVVQNDIQYAYNSATANSSDTTSFAYGPAGVAFGAYTTSIRAKRVRFTTPISATDQIWLEANDITTNTWTKVPGSLSIGRNYQNGVNYGMWWDAVASSATDIDVSFGEGGRLNSTTYGGTSTFVWNDIAATFKWRAAKASGGQSVGFSNVTQTGAGLVQSAGQLLGTNTNTGSVMSEPPFLCGTADTGVTAIPNPAASLGATPQAKIPYAYVS